MRWRVPAVGETRPLVFGDTLVDVHVVRHHHRHAEVSVVWRAVQDGSELGRSLVQRYERFHHLARAELAEDGTGIRTTFTILDWALRGQVDRPTLALFAIDERGIAATALVPTRHDVIETAIVGRHRNADVWLQDEHIALRHLAVIVHPRGAGPLRYRVLDLRTHLGFHDERFRPLESIEADGPVFVHVGRYVVLVLPLDGRLGWPDDPLQAWRALPDRVYDGDPRSRRDPFPPAAFPGAESGTTGVQTLPGPQFARWRMDDGATPVGEVRVRSADGEMALVVSAHELHRGILMGRYDRCDDAGNKVLRHHAISRVHMLLIEVGGRIYAIDTASTHRVWVDHTRVRRHAVDEVDEIMLGNRLAWLRWSPVH